MRSCSEHGDNSNVCDCFPKPATVHSLSDVYFEMACELEKQSRFQLAKLYLARALSKIRYS
ncbi:hypothetical protein HWB51_gp053 [Mycobacterium phage Cuke]|uniref:Uncharacterized protein n=1 Tax=Mycobacterium phage Cuke TaxID=2079417 RepID=A0A2L1IWV8_9CAUD|nr:hypothetical protein HWB51_gp053 [Mycobacterium phage Cuke]AVD99671.1 hypothetical protein SEA_CUKE_53 [Mycobacterium phage Cuke]